jgi:DNA-binding response OmpR family regulator
MSKVLVVDDDQSIVTIVRYHLESAGFQSVFADDANEGWRLLVTEKPDIAVVDIKLPGEDGWSFIQRIRSDERYGDLPVVILTGLLGQEFVDKARQLGCQYLGKPFAATALLGKVRTLLEGVDNAPVQEKPSSPHRIELAVVPVVLLLDAYRIEGHLHLPPELGRFSDAWESVMRDTREYVPVTDVNIKRLDGGEVVSSPFIEVRKADVRAVFPLDLTS